MLRGTFQWPCPCGEPLPALTGAPPTLAGSSGWVSCGVTAPPFCVLMHTKFCLCPPRLESLVPSVLWKACDQIPLALKARFPGDSQSLCWIPRLGFRTFVIVGELLWCYCSPVCGSPTWQVWDLILLWLRPSYCLAAASSLSLDVGYLFLVGSNILLSIVVQQVIAILVLLPEEISTHPSTLPSWAGRPLVFYIYLCCYFCQCFLLHHMNSSYYVEVCFILTWKVCPLVFLVGQDH